MPLMALPSVNQSARWNSRIIEKGFGLPVLVIGGLDEVMSTCFRDVRRQKAKAARGRLASFGVGGGLFDDLVEFALGVTLGHLFQRDDLDLAGAAGAAEGFEAGQTDFLGRFAGRLQVV